MDEIKTKAIRNLESKMEGIEEGSLRYKVLDSARQFKSSWIELGQMLYTVWKDKLYKEWDYSTFDIYAAKEVGIRKETAFKLLKSYSFLEKEEPQLISGGFKENAQPGQIPGYEAVNALRLAKNNKNLDQNDYSRIRKYVLEKGKDAKEVKKDLTQLIKQREELEPEEARAKKKTALLKRFIGALKTIQTEIKVSKLLPAQLIKEADSLIKKLESEIPL